MNEAFMSDNTAPVDGRILDILNEANEGFAKSYGYDRWTDEVANLFRREFGSHAEVFPVLTGTGANVISLASILSPFQGVVCSESAHINVNECGAPERFLGGKLLPVKGENGKISPNDIKPLLHSVGFEHCTQPYVISISQVAETGVAYTRDELAGISAFAKENSMLLHIDGSRLANAAQYLNCSLSEAVKGADVVSFGGTKNGMLMGEAVLFLNPELSVNCKYFRKQAMQLFSKMRYISAQFIPYLRDGVWLENASQANRMARRLSYGLVEKGYKLAYPLNSNIVFVYLDRETIEKIEKEFYFYIWDEETMMSRFICSFATKEEDVDRLLSII